MKKANVPIPLTLKERVHDLKVWIDSNDHVHHQEAVLTGFECVKKGWFNSKILRLLSAKLETISWEAEQQAEQAEVVADEANVKALIGAGQASMFTAYVRKANAANTRRRSRKSKRLCSLERSYTA